MRRVLVVLMLVLLAGLAVYVDTGHAINIGFLGYNNSDQLKEGLDLKGGIQFLFQAECPANNSNCDIASSIGPTIQNILTRINGSLGVSEAIVNSQSNGSTQYISVQLPGVTNDSQALSLIGTTGQLNFIDTSGQQLQVGSTVTNGQYPIRFTGQQLDPTSISVSIGTTNQYQVNFEFNAATRNSFATYTGNNIGKYLTITLDNTVIESAVIQSQITGSGEISGSFTQASASQLASFLKYGALPLQLTKISERQIDASLGSQSIFYSERAALIGIGLVIFFMLLYYRLPGFVATIALLLYAALVLMVIRVLGVVLTLAGIAGVILSIGMAVDANILIFERIKEELRAGRTMMSAIEFGWSRAWPSIRDSNASTIITCLILSIFGNNFGATIIVGFATNLLIGVLVSLFTAVVVTRTLLNVVIQFPGVLSHPALFGVPAGVIRPTGSALKRKIRQNQPALAGAANNLLPASSDDETEGEE